MVVRPNSKSLFIGFTYKGFKFMWTLLVWAFSAICYCPLYFSHQGADVLATDGMLVKRPILVGDDFVLVGFKEVDWAAKLGK